MGETIPVAHNFDQGFHSDIARDELAPNAAYRMTDWIPQLEAPLRKRGGWVFGSPDFSVLGGNPASVASIGWLPFAGDGQLVAVANDGSVYQLKQFNGLGGAQLTDTGDTGIVPSWPVFWHKALNGGVVLGGYSQTARAPKKVYLSGVNYVVQPLGGTPPMARSGFSWGDYLVLLNYYDPSDTGTLKNYRMAFSGVGQPEVWTLSGVNAGTFDFPEEIVAGCPVRNAILVWGYNDCHILTGDTPPPGGNLDRKILFAGQGTFDGRSVASWRDYAIWANASGVWQSDGATLTELTAVGGISNYWRELVSGFTFAQGWRACAGIYRDHYVIQIVNGFGIVVTTLLCDLSRKVWFEFDNITAGMFVQRPAGPGTALFAGDEELFFADVAAPRIGRMSTCWTPSAAYALDGNAQPVLPSLETAFFKLGQDGLKRYRNLYVTYDIRSSGSSPLLVASAVFTPEPDATYTSLSPELTDTTSIRRAPIGIRRAGLGAGLKIQQVGPSADTMLYGLEFEGHPQEGTR